MAAVRDASPISFAPLQRAGAAIRPRCDAASLCAAVCYLRFAILPVFEFTGLRFMDSQSGGRRGLERDETRRGEARADTRGYVHVREKCLVCILIKRPFH